MATQVVKIATLVYDPDLYPRSQVDSTHIANMVRALQAGANLPPLTADRKTKKIVDGIHRWNAYRRAFGLDAEATVQFKDYASEAEMFLDAVRLNASHGKPLSSFEHMKCILRADELHIDRAQIGEALHIPIQRVEYLDLTKTGRPPAGYEPVRKDGTPFTQPPVLAGKVPLKPGYKHLAGQTMTADQIEGNSRAVGLNQIQLVNRVIELIETGGLDKENEPLMARLAYLFDLKDKALAVFA